MAEHLYLSHPFKTICLESPKEFKSRETQLELARIRANRIHQIIEETRTAFPKIDSDQGIRADEKKRQIVRFILEKVRERPGLLHPDADVPHPETGRTLLEDFEDKLLEGIQKPVTADRLSLAKLQLIGPFFGRELRTKFKDFTASEKEKGKTLLGPPDKAVGLAAIHSSGFSDLARHYVQTGQYAGLEPEILDRIEEDYFRATEIRKHPASTINTASAILEKAHPKVEAEAEKVDDALDEHFEIPLGASPEMLSGDVYSLQRRFQGPLFDRRDLLNSIRLGLVRQYPQFLEAVSGLAALTPSKEHVESMVHYFFTHALTEGVNTLGMLERFATELEKKQKELGVSPVRLAFKGVDRLWRTPAGKKDLVWILPKDPAQLLRAMKELAKLYADNEAHTRFSVKFVNRNAGRQDNQGKPLGTDYMRHVRHLVNLLSYAQRTLEPPTPEDVQKEALGIFRKDVFELPNGSEPKTAVGKSASRKMPKGISAPERTTRETEKRQRAITDAKTTVENARGRIATLLNQARTAGTSEMDALHRRIEIERSTIDRQKKILAGLVPAPEVPQKKAAKKRPGKKR